MSEIGPRNTIHYFIAPEKVVSVRMKAADFCLDFLPLSKGSMEPDTGINTDLENTQKGKSTSQLL